MALTVERANQLRHGDTLAPRTIACRSRAERHLGVSLGVSCAVTAPTAAVTHADSSRASPQVNSTRGPWEVLVPELLPKRPPTEPTLPEHMSHCLALPQQTAASRTIDSTQHAAFTGRTSNRASRIPTNQEEQALTTCMLIRDRSGSGS
ncbi:hypothetical protein PGTUg99_015757 [Puccinia graminis f. sp. tritici]|uniref:Uncharacterized protein n=1 Tax=Puccinia graminis f. sp. tritici TaxID=56615 RepID=A0A5B0RC95_PUCGR|nr:hypothetical protein PGTUg99_015757 [Puccinia graminis f. sp. tritici]